MAPQIIFIAVAEIVLLRYTYLHGNRMNGQYDIKKVAAVIVGLSLLLLWGGFFNALTKN